MYIVLYAFTSHLVLVVIRKSSDIQIEIHVHTYELITIMHLMHMHVEK